MSDSDYSAIPMLGRGFFWQDLAVGQTFRTFRRTITEADLVGFIGVTGMLELIFIDAEYEGAIGGRPVPLLLTQGIIEGMLMQTMIQGTGLAMLDIETKIKGPVRVNDTVWATVEVASVRPTSKGGRGLVGCLVTVLNQKNDVVLTYTVTRLLAGRPT